MTWHAVVLEILANQWPGKPSGTSRGACLSILVTWNAVVLEILVNQWPGKPSRTSRGAYPSILVTWHAVVLEKSKMSQLTR